MQIWVKGMFLIMIDFKKQAQRVYKPYVPEINTKTRNKKCDSIQIPIQQPNLRILCKKTIKLSNTPDKVK